MMEIGGQEMGVHPLVGSNLAGYAFHLVVFLLEDVEMVGEKEMNNVMMEIADQGMGAHLGVG